MSRVGLPPEFAVPSMHAFLAAHAMLAARVALAAAGIFAALGLSCLSCTPDPARVHAEAVVCDMHCDTLMRVLNGYKLGERNAEGHIDLPRLAEGGVDVQFFACWPSPDFLSKGEGDPDSSARRVRAMIDGFYNELAANPDKMGLALNAAQARSIIAEGKIAAVLAIEGGHAIQDSLEILQEFYDRGVRYMTLTWNNSNNWADAALDASEGRAVHGGLTDFGRQVVETMNRLGMMVDVSHVSEGTFCRTRAPTPSAPTIETSTTTSCARSRPTAESSGSTSTPDIWTAPTLAPWSRCRRSTRLSSIPWRRSTAASAIYCGMQEERSTIAPHRR
jgi:hypothetical protein